MGSARVDRDGDPFYTSTPTAKRDARTRELVEAERLVAETHRSGVRTKTPEIGSAPSFDISNAVTKVHRAVELDMFLPPTVEVSVVVSETIALAPPPPNHDTSARPRLEIPAHVSPVTTPGVLPLRERQVRSSGRLRRALLACLVVAVMAGASALLVAAARQGRLPIHPALAPLVERAARLLR